MNKGIICLVAILLTSVAAYCAYCAYFGWATAKSPNDALEWLQVEYALDDEVMGEVTLAKATYLPECREMCRRLAEARQKLSDRSSSSTATTSEITEAYAAVNAIEEECIRMSLDHVFTVAAMMPESQGKRYRDRMVAALLRDRTGQHQRHSDMIKGGNQ